MQTSEDGRAAFLFEHNKTEEASDCDQKNREHNDGNNRASARAARFLLGLTRCCCFHLTRARTDRDRSAREKLGIRAQHGATRTKHDETSALLVSTPTAERAGLAATWHVRLVAVQIARAVLAAACVGRVQNEVRLRDVCCTVEQIEPTSFRQK